MTHLYDGTMNDGFCAECGHSQEQGDHIRADASIAAWQRSLRIQRTVRESNLQPTEPLSHTEAIKA